MTSKIIGVILIIIGVVLALWGYDIYDSASVQLNRTLTGDTPIKVWAGMAGGIATVLIGFTWLK
ncbi:DUF3185 family protein [Cognaticolwellia mytili]|uniref:DUF3185 family protein n=1 Tax=Cognaticolwellia mytili TaxID=1888913 RepID=UPI000A16EA26|nr:DUF3185 family protein [Cognaticolwellia mytili]